MKRWIRFVATLYPRSWRDEYGKEFDALLDDVKPGWRVFANVLRGAVTMQLMTGTNWLKLATATASVGAVIAGGLSFTVPPNYASTEVLSVTPQPDPLRPASPQELQRRAADRLAEMKLEILSATSLSSIIQNPSLDLYKAERLKTSLEDVIREMRGNIRIQARSLSDGGIPHIVFNISFSYPDQVKAQAVVRALGLKFRDANANLNRESGTIYRNFWRDLSAARVAQPAPPPPVGDVLTVVKQASLPVDSEAPHRKVFLAYGLGGGLLLGLLAALAMRRPHSLLLLAGLAALGLVDHLGHFVTAMR